MPLTFTRRSVLRGLGAAGLGLPFLGASRALRADATALPKRLIVFAMPNGTVLDHFWPADGTTIGGPILEPLAPFASKLNLYRGLDMVSAQRTPVPKDHWPDFFNALTARQPLGDPSGDDFQPAGPSIDQLVARAVGGETRYASLQLGVQTGYYCGVLSAARENEALRPENDPFAAFGRLFGETVGEEAPAARVRAERRSILDAVRGDLQESRCRLGAADRARLEVHLESIRGIERTLDGLARTCVAPDLGSRFGEVGEGHDGTFPLLGRLQMDLAAAALRCDLTRVITLQWGRGASTVSHEWAGAPYTHHGIAHNSEGVSASSEDRRRWMVQVARWYAEQLGHLLRTLDETPEGDGTLLDQCAVLWLHEQSNAETHQRSDMPYVLAGSCGGAIPLGRRTDYGGVPHSRLLTAIARAMDVEVGAFGDPDVDSEPVEL